MEMLLMEPQYSILIAEDDEDERFLLQRAFQKAGVRNPIHFVVDGEQALDYLQARGIYAERDKYPFPKFLIIDIKMPKKNGFDVLKWLKDHPECSIIPAIVLTSSKQPSDIVKAYALGANSYFVKPASVESLQKLVTLLCEYWSICAKPEVSKC